MSAGKRVIVLLIVENDEGIMQALSPIDMLVDKLNIETPVEKDPAHSFSYVTMRHTGEITINIEGRRRLDDAGR